MIYTVTLNPSIDYFVDLDHFSIGEVNRVKKEKKMPGGKGINVSRVLKRLETSSHAFGFVGGFTGDFVRTSLENEAIATHFIEVPSETRINVKIKAKEETELNGEGPHIEPSQLDALFAQISELKSGDWLVLAGSVPPSLPNDIYQNLLAIAVDCGAKIIVDTTGDYLKQTLPFHPFLIKPNQHELEDYYRESAQDVIKTVSLARRLLDEGAENVIVSMGGAGALLVNSKESLRASVPKGEVKNSVGAGDSLVAGFLAAYSAKNDLHEAFRFGVAAGSATAFSVDLCTHEKVMALLPEIEIDTL
jgi:1-phosphofructokinase